MRKAPLLLWLMALAGVAVQAMALATRYFQPWLDGDYLLVQRFAADVLSGDYPLSGWTLSSSPYFFPDFAFGLFWHAVLRGAPLLPYYVVTNYVALALLAGWTLQRIHQADGAATPAGTDRPTVREWTNGGPGGRALPRSVGTGFGWLLGALLVNALLVWQGAADHARWLWWLGTANMHGGAVLLGLAQFALWAGPAETTPTHNRRAVATVLLFLGLASDTLLFTQFILPLGAALLLSSRPPRWRAPRVKAFLLSLIIALALVGLLRAALVLADWWNFPSVVRYAPTPAAIAGTAARMFGDFLGNVRSAVPGFFLLFLFGVGGAVWLTRQLHKPGAQRTPEQRQAGWFAVICLSGTLALPVLAVYWQNPQHGRYLLPCLVIPLWWLFAVLPLARLRTPFVAGLVTASLLGLVFWRAPQIDFAKWTWPYPDNVAELDALLAQEGRADGLADYWHANLLNAVARKVRLNQVRPDGRVQFWGNNAFHHFALETPGATLQPRRYAFIIANDLDPVAIRTKYGEPARTATAGGYDVWFYEKAGAERLSALVDAEVRTFLGNRPGTERIAK